MKPATTTISISEANTKVDLRIREHVVSCRSEAVGYAQTNLLECKIALFGTAFFILIPASTWAGLIAANFFFGYL
jgi:hypothetical protein